MSLSETQREDRVLALLISIREACGQIQAHVENIEGSDEDDRLNSLWEWAEEVSSDTYQFTGGSNEH